MLAIEARRIQRCFLRAAITNIGPRSQRKICPVRSHESSNAYRNPPNIDNARPMDSSYVAA